MNPFSLKNQKFHFTKSNSNLNLVRSNKREISIIQEVKENNTKSKNTQSPKEKTYPNKLIKNKSTIMEINNENSEGSQDNIYKSSEEEEENKNQNNFL